MVSYEVKYRKLGSFFWKTLKAVKGDMILKPEAGVAVRVFLMQDESRVEIPAELCEFKFSKERFFNIKQSTDESKPD